MSSARTVAPSSGLDCEDAAAISTRRPLRFPPAPRVVLRVDGVFEVELRPQGASAG
jgi:hypothetical protein